MGRPALTEREAFLHGTKSKARPAPESGYCIGHPKAPAHLCHEALTEFKRVSKILAARQTQTDGDASNLAVYSEVYSRWVAAKRLLASEGLQIPVTVLDSNGQAFTNKKLNPLLKVVEACETRLLALIKSLGLSPDSRERVKPLAKVDEGKLPPAPGTIAWMLVNGRSKPNPEPATDSNPEGELADAV